jgi:hypothetical protein
MVEFLKVLYYFENVEFKEYHKTKKSTTSTKAQGDLYPREVIVSILRYSSINNAPHGEVYSWFFLVISLVHCL